MGSYDSVKKWRKKAKERAILAFGGKCGICKYKKHPCAIDFHHINKARKKFTIGSLKSTKWSIIVKELKKCVCLCANCHREVEAGVTKLPKNIPRFNRKFEKWATDPEKKYDKCPICKGKKKKRLKYCSIQCAAYSKRKVIWNKKQLEQMLKEKMPITLMAKKIGVSGNAVKKMLAKFKLSFSKHDREFTITRGFYQKGRIKGTKYKGICQDKSGKRRKRWISTLSIPKNKTIFIGLFATPKEAAIAYDKKAEEVLGKYAITNKRLGLL